MPKTNVPIRDDKRVYLGEQATGVAWSPGLTGLDLRGWTTGDVAASGPVETYADAQAWSDGESGPSSATVVTIEPWRLRNFFREHKAAALEILSGFEGLLLADVTGDAVPIGTPSWLDEPAESAPQTPPEG